MSYDFLVLSPDEFEKFSHDLIECELNIELERFKPGKDGGIDLRNYINKDNQIIVQCKRYSSFNELKRNLEKEVEKVKKLNPSRYIIVTSVPLSPDNKTKIMEIFSGFIKTTHDIIGKDDLTDLLGKHPQIEKNHFKLWLSSINVMQKILHNSIQSRSEFTEEEIKLNAKLYVQNESLNQAQDLLAAKNTVILSGSPGVGKTTLARMLILELAVNEYELISISRDIEEAETVYQKGKKQVFYYDDFLGSNFLEDRLEKNEDKRLISFINKIAKSENNEKKFIMTTREYILNQAKMKYEILNDKEINFSKHIVDVKSYTDLVKAQILYNHLFFSQINPKFIKEIITNKNYLKIINHKNYNPRVIETMTFKLNPSISSGNYLENFLQNLNNPISIWEHAFDYQITETSKLILYILAIKGRGITKVELESSYQCLSRDMNQPYNRRLFNDSLKELENTFINIRRTAGASEFIINFHNPSIRDFLIGYLKESQDIVISLIRSTFELKTTLKVLSTNPSEGKILLNGENQFEVANLAIRKYYEEKSLEATRRVNSQNYIDILRDISRFFDLNTHKNIKEFVLKEVEDFSNLYILPLDHQKSMISLFAENLDLFNDKQEVKEMLVELCDNVDYIFDIEIFEFIKTKLPDIYESISMEIDIQGIILRAVDKEMEQVNDSNYDAGSLVDLLLEVDIEYGLDMSDYLEELDSSYQSGEPDYDDYYEDYDRHIEYHEPDVEDTNDIIDDMFDSLLDD